MNASQRNANPINLRFAGQTEASGHDSDNFAIFPTHPAGWRGAHAQIKKDQDRGLTLRAFINKFAPPNENDTSAYLQFVADAFKVSELVLLSSINRFALAGVMAQFEGYYNKEVI